MTLEDSLAAEHARAELHRRQLDALETEIAPLTMGPNCDDRARALAFGILWELVARFAAACQLGEVSKAIAAAQKVQSAAMPKEAMLDACVRADTLASLLCSHVGPRGAWPLDLQIPFDLANMLRRACEHNAADFLALVILDARRLLTATAMRQTPEPVDRLIADAVGVT